ncbi:MAG: class 1 fructose-bisphosphatase [Neisseriaceae bacterium]|nr:class 1 fructose-bisphosphatase [Neisseriaceae bacterium]
MSLLSFLEQHQKQHHLPDDLIQTAKSIVNACTQISQKVRLGALSDVLGEAGSGNIQGEAQKKLDVIANQIMIQTLQNTNSVAGLASEEEDTFVSGSEKGSYLVLFDPLDGSSNIDVNISIGTIFSVLPKPNSGSLKESDFLQSGANQVLAGYVLYGVQTQLVLTFGHGVFAFTLNDKNEFIMTKENITIPAETAEFAINMSNYRHWENPMRDYIDELLAGKDGVRGKNYNMRWVASMVAEVHRILMRGGVFMYPKDHRDPSKPGKLRLMYEANPMSWLITQAGGGATNAMQAILTIQPTGLHQRVAVILGSQEEVDRVTRKHSQG